MARTQIKDNLNRTIGYIENRPDGTKVAYDSTNRRKGHYSPYTKTTYNERNQSIGRGDQLIRMIPSYEERIGSRHNAGNMRSASKVSPKSKEHRGGASKTKDDGTAFVVLILFLVICALISPGLIFNLAVGRFGDHADGLLAASVHDVPTWIFSAFVWGCIIFFGFLLKRPRFILGRFILFCSAVSLAAFIFYVYTNVVGPAKAVAFSKSPNRAGSDQIKPSPDSDSLSLIIKNDDRIIEPDSHPIEEISNLPHEAEPITSQLTELTFSARHKHTFGGCKGTLTLTPDKILFESESHRFESLMHQVKLHKDGIQDHTGKRWHFIIEGESVPLLLDKWKNQKLFANDLQIMGTAEPAIVK